MKLLDDPPCEESADAGAFYCAHVLWGLQSVPVPVDGRGRRRVGFIHLPDDRGRTGGDRFGALRTVLTYALRGAGRELDEAGLPRRVLLLGFAPFADVADNPSGTFVTSSEELTRLEREAWPGARELGPAPALLSAALPVDDRVLGAAGLGRLVAQAAPSAVIGLGVARRRHVLQVEAVPTDAGLSDDGRRHQKGAPARTRGPVNRWLAEAVLRGASSSR